MTEAASALVAYCREKERVCPQPQRWHHLWEILPNKRQIGAGWQPSLPLILAAWHDASNLEKMFRLSQHIEWADEHGKLAEVDAFLRGLQEEDWHHLAD
jgi:hypothetical protein